MSVGKVRPVDPLRHDVPIVDAHGRPTAQFSRQWVQARTINVLYAQTAVSLEGLDEDFVEHRDSSQGVHGIADTADIILEGDARLTNARTPTAHAASHASGGLDAVSLASLAASIPSITGATTQDQVDSIVTALVALGLVTDDR